MYESKPWLKFYNPEKTPEHIDYPDISNYEIVRQAAERVPDNIAYEFEGKTTTYKAMMEKIDHVAACLYKLGVRKGDNVVVCMPNTPQAIQIFYGIIKCGGVATMIHPLSAKNEIEYYLKNSHAKVALTLNAFAKNFIDVKENTELETLLVADIRDELSFIKAVGFQITKGKKIPKLPELPYIMKWKDFLKIAKGTDMPDIEVKGTDPAVILYSGGTTGVSKGIVLSSLNFTATAQGTLATSECLPLTIEEMYSDKVKEVMNREYIVLSVMPLFHGFGLGIGVHAFLSFGGKCILVPTFTPETFSKLIVKKRPNYIAGVPTLYEKMIRSEAMQDADLSCLEGIFSGGDSLPVETKRRVDAFLKEHNCKTTIREGYGLTESVTASCLTPVREQREGSIGIPFPDNYYKIVKIGTTEEVPAGEEGEICMCGPNIMIGYFENQKETDDVLKVHEDGMKWLHTGDIGMMDEDGFVYFRQRYKRLIISSGYNIYPSQIENIIDKYPGVSASCAIGIPDPIRQQVVKVFIVLDEGVEPSEELTQNIKAYCRENISKFSMPKYFEYIDKIPTTKVGKVAYRELEELEAKRREEKKESQ